MSDSPAVPPSPAHPEQLRAEWLAWLTTEGTQWTMPGPLARAITAALDALSPAPPAEPGHDLDRVAQVVYDHGTLEDAQAWERLLPASPAPPSPDTRPVILQRPDVPPNERARFLLERVVEYRDEHGDVANAGDNDLLRDALMLAADELRTLRPAPPSREPPPSEPTLAEDVAEAHEMAEMMRADGWATCWPDKLHRIADRLAAAAPAPGEAERLGYVAVRDRPGAPTLLGPPTESKEGAAAWASTASWPAVICALVVVE